MTARASPTLAVYSDAYETRRSRSLRDTRVSWGASSGNGPAVRPYHLAVVDVHKRCDAGRARVHNLLLLEALVDGEEGLIQRVRDRHVARAPRLGKVLHHARASEGACVR